MLAETSSFLVDEVVFQVMSLSMDVIILLSVALFSFAYTLYAGKSKSIINLLSLWVVGFLFFTFPFWEEVIPSDFSLENETFIKLAAFISIFLLVRILLREIVYTHYPERNILKLLQAGILSVVFTTLLFMFLYQILSFEILYMFSSPLREILFDSRWLFISLTISIFGLYFVKRSE